MSTRTLSPELAELLRGRPLLPWALRTPMAPFTRLPSTDAGCLFVATSSQTRKARNVTARPRATLMVDVRKPAGERGVTAAGAAEILSGSASREMNRRIHGRYMSAAAMSDPHIEPVLASFDDVTIKLTPSSWTAWDTAVLDAQAFGGRLGKTPGYMLPLDGDTN